MKAVFRIVLLFLFIAAFFYMEEVFLKKDIFKVKKIWIFGDTKLTGREIQRQMGSVVGEYLWLVDTEAIEDMIKEDVRVDDVKIKKIMPNEMVVDIKEKNPSYYVQYNGRVYSLDDEGKPFAYLEETPVRDIPLLLIKDEGDIPELLEVLMKVKGKKFEKLISQVYIYNKKCINFVIFDGTIVRTDNSVEEKKYEVAERLYSELKREQKKIEYIDLRFGDYIVK